MEHSMAHPGGTTAPLELPAWKTVAATVSAVLMALLWIVAGVWKITDPLAAAARMSQALVPVSLSLPAALLFGISETFTGVLLLVPRFRRWGAILSVLLLVAFVVYIGIHYGALRGEECNCFPWVKRAVGPIFFISDGIMVLLSVIAGVWARRSESVRSALIILGAVFVFAMVSYGVTAARQSGLEAPDSVTADGKPYSLQQGKIFVYFFDPQCAHCDQAARQMSRWNWGETKVLAVVTATPHFGRQFLSDTGLKAALSADAELLQQTFKFTNPPYGVALEHGRQKAAFVNFDKTEPFESLKRLAFVQ